MAELSVWCNDCEWVIAESAEDAVKVWEETTGGNWADEFEDETFYPDNKPEWKIWFESEDDAKTYAPEGSEIGRQFENDGYWYAKATQEQWMQKIGRGYLCGEDW